jgi:hypothetical protein
MSGTTQTFRDLAADQMIEIAEGTDAFKVIRQPKLSVPKSTAAAGPSASRSGH